MRICELCGEPISPFDVPYRLISGWEKPRTGGGTNAVALRHPYDKWAHTACVTTRIKGPASAQLELF